MRSLILTLSFTGLGLCACGHVPVGIPAAVPEAYLQKCPEKLPDPYDAALTQPDHLTKAEDTEDDLTVTGQYNECRDIHNALVDWHLKE